MPDTSKSEYWPAKLGDKLVAVQLGREEHAHPLAAKGVTVSDPMDHGCTDADVVALGHDCTHSGSVQNLDQRLGLVVGEVDAHVAQRLSHVTVLAVEQAPQLLGQFLGPVALGRALGPLPGPTEPWPEADVVPRLPRISQGAVHPLASEGAPGAPLRLANSARVGSPGRCERTRRTNCSAP